LIPIELYNNSLLACGGLLCKYSKLLLRGKIDNEIIQNMIDVLDDYIKTLDELVELNLLDGVKN
jgi:hypothetical protein